MGEGENYNQSRRRAMMGERRVSNHLQLWLLHLAPLAVEFSTWESTDILT